MTLLGSFLGIVTLAFLDSLNPFSIASMALVIGGNASLSRGLVFIVTTFLIYLIGGILILNGWAAALKALIPFVTPSIAMIGWAVLALASWIGATMLWFKSPSAADIPTSPKSVSALIGVFVFAVGSTLSDLPTAIPYFAAAPMILATGASLIVLGCWLAVYTLIYVSPLILLLWLRQFASAKFEPLIGKIRISIDFIVRRLCPPLLIVLGIWALLHLINSGSN